MKFKFQSYVDLQTSAESMQVIQWSVGGAEVINRCRHLFGAFKYFKLGKISVKLVPASTLPVDPLQLSYDLDDPQSVDPRDQMNPGLVRITNGEDLFTNISVLSADQMEGMYKSMMLDPRWSKFMLQSGFRRSAYPLYWQIGQLNQDKYPGSTINFPVANSSGLNTAAANTKLYGTNPTDGNLVGRATVESSARGLFQVGHRGRMGFLPTDFYQDLPTNTTARFNHNSGYNNVPEVQVITCVLPKAYKTLYFYRCYITEEVIFSGLRSGPIGYPGIDQFLVSQPSNLFGPAWEGPLPYGDAAQYLPNNGDELP